MADTRVIGRETERAVIDGWLDAASHGSLLIDGVAGIGKSTLWSYALDRAVTADCRVLAWRTSTAERELAFAVLTALFDRPDVLPALARLASPRRRAMAVALGRLDPEGHPPEPSLVGLATADLLRVLAADLVASRLP